MTTSQTPHASRAASLEELRSSMVDYLLRAQVRDAGTFFGSFWSEKAYHGPLLDFHAGGAHHNRGAGSAALALHVAGPHRETDLKRQAELAFDWLVTRQRPSGGFLEIQNHDRASDWEGTGLEECSMIATAFAMRGLAYALLNGLPPKPSYATALRDAGLWALGQERPAGSGIFPHHERSPSDCLNANLHAAEMLYAIYCALERVYHQPVNIFSEGARRAVEHTLTCQNSDGSFPYRAGGGVTLNYTAIVGWCLLNLVAIAPGRSWARQVDTALPMQRAADFLRQGFDPERGLNWQRYESSTARHNTHTYALLYNVLMRVGGEDNRRVANEVLDWLLARRADAGLLPVKDVGEPIFECLPMQADIYLALELSVPGASAEELT